MNDPLFEPITLDDLELKNRIYMPAMHLNMTMDFTVTERMVEFYAERARGGAGMICAGFATVDEYSGGISNIGAHDDSFVEGLAALAAAIRANGARAALQLNHAGRYNHSFMLGGKEPRAPSPIASRLTRETPHEMTVEEVRETIAAFGKAAKRVQRAAFDAVEILSGTGYLISEFLSPLTNQRTDEYGGSFEKRMRFGLEVAEEVRRATGNDFPVIFRINGNEFMPGGLRRAQLQDYAARLAGKGVCALCVNVGWHEARVPQIVAEVPRGAFAYLARGIKHAAGVPVIASHRINDPSIARELIGDGSCDMVAIGRGLIADPYFPEKAKQSREREIVHCVGCAQGCFDHLFELKAVECLCNPRAGHETELRIEPAATRKKVLVIGGGPAGMSAAIGASERAHDVTLYERGDVLGGQLRLAGAAPGREEFAQLAADLEHQLEARGVPVERGATVDGDLLAAEKPDAVILATGARPIRPEIPGVEHEHVVQAWDVLADRVRTGRRVVVVGGGAVGVETALLLAGKGTVPPAVLKFLLVHNAEKLEDLHELCTRGSKEVTLVEMLDKLGLDIGKTTRWVLLQDLELNGVRSRVATEVMEITESGIKVKSGDAVEEIPADTVVLAVGAAPDNPLQAVVEEQGIPCQVVGDARAVAKAFDAVHAGYRAGRAI